MKRLYAFVVVSFVILLSGCIKYPLPDATLTPNEVCGKSQCTPGNFGVSFHFTKDPYSPDITEATKPIDIAYSIVGKTVGTKDKTGGMITACNKDEVSNPFSISDIRMKGSITGRDIQYSRTTTLDINIIPSVSATINELKKVVDITNYVSELEAKLEAGYKSIDSSTSTLTGLYYEWGLSNTVINTLNTPKYSECKNYLIEEEKSLITAVGFINFKTHVQSNEYSKFIADINAVFTAHGLNFDVSPVINHELTKSISASINDGYQILVWRKTSPYSWGK